MERLFPVIIVEGKDIPVFTELVKTDWYTVQEDARDIAHEAPAIDMTFLDVRRVESGASQLVSVQIVK